MSIGKILLGVRLTPNDYKSVEIENCNLEETVDSFKNTITKEIGVDKCSIALIYCGVILEDNKSLLSCGVRPGVMLHVLPKPKSLQTSVQKTFTDLELEQLVNTFKFKFMSTDGYRTALQRLSRPEVIETVKSAVPQLFDDPVALAIIQDPELIVQLSQMSVVKLIAQHHPAVIDAAFYIAAHVHEETATANTTRAGPSTAYSYSLEALSDEDNDMDSANDQPREANTLTRNTSYGAITAAQLADAILNSTQNANFGENSQPGNTTSSASRSNIITNEMISNAIQQAIASTPASSSSTSVPLVLEAQNPTVPTTSVRNQSNLSESNPPALSGLQTQIQQMREMGLTNDSVNLRALQVTSGDVHAAVELVFSGVIE